MQIQMFSSIQAPSRSPHPAILQSLSTDSQLDARSHTSRKSRKSIEQKIEVPIDPQSSHRFFRRTNPSPSLNDSSESSSSQDLENSYPAKRPKRAHEIFRPSPPSAASSSPRSVSDSFQQFLSRSDDGWIQRCNAFDEDDEEEEIPEFMASITE